jgi:ssDNA thymidine ADP-ribosyltransferase, DarT
LQADLGAVVTWANAQPARWAFTLSNAGSYFFEDRNDLARLGEINWTAVQANNWSGGLKEGKQAEFLLEQRFPWHLVERIGVHSAAVYGQVVNALPAHGHRPPVEVRPDWYY